MAVANSRPMRRATTPGAAPPVAGCGAVSGAAGGGHGSLRGEERRKEGRRRRGDTLPGATGSRVQAPEPPAPPALMPLRPPLQPRSRAARGRRRPAAGHRRDLRANAAGEPRQGAAAAARRAHADPRAGAAASPRLEEGRARTLEPRPGGSPAPWKQPLPTPEPGVVASPALWCFCSRRWKSRAQARCERRRPMRLG